MPAMIVLLLIIAGYAITNGDFASAVRIYVLPGFSKLTYSGVLIALGHAFFTLSLASWCHHDLWCLLATRYFDL